MIKYIYLILIFCFTSLTVLNAQTRNENLIDNDTIKCDSILLHLKSIKLIDNNYIDYISKLVNFVENFNVTENEIVLNEFKRILNDYRSIEDYNNENYWEGLIEVGGIYQYSLGSRDVAVKLYAECAEIAFDSNKVELCSKMLDKAAFAGIDSEYSFDIFSPSKTVILTGDSEYYDMLNPFAPTRNTDYDMFNRINSDKEFHRTGLIANAYRLFGSDMIKDYEKCAELSKTINNKNHSHFLQVIAGLYRNSGNYDKAIDRYDEIAYIYFKDANDVLNALKNIAEIYEENIQNYEKAINAYKEYEKKCNEKHQYYRSLDALHKIAHIHYIKKDYQKAIYYCQEIVKACCPSQGDDNKCLGALTNIAYMLYFDKETTLDNKIKECTKILKFFDDHPTNPEKAGMPGAKFTHYLPVLYVLAESYYAKGEYQKVIDYSKRLFEIPDYAYHDSYFFNYNFIHAEPEENKIPFYDFIVRSLYHLKEDDEAKEYYNVLIESFKKIVVNNFLGISEFQRESFWNENQLQTMYLAGAMALQSHDFQSKFIGDFFNTSLFLKGILLNSSIELNKIILESGDSDLIDYFNKYKEVCKNILQGNGNKYLYDEKDIFEKNLTQMSKEYGDFMHFLNIKWQDIQATLNSAEIVVDFVNFPINKTEIKHAALLLKKDWENPLFVSLFSEQDLSDRTQTTANYDNLELGKMIWEPILKHIKNDSVIYFSVSGSLHQLPIEYLPINDSTPLNKMYNVHRLSSPRQLVDIAKEQAIGNSAVLFGGINYGIESKDTIQRGFSAKFLAGTKIEVENIAQILSKERIETQLFQGDIATKTLFQKLSGKQLDIIHIATHGFYFSDEDEMKYPIVAQIIKKDTTQKSIEGKTMVRSGLLFAGANNIFSKEFSAGTDDGILTAQEISLMDLRGVDLVVLSACQTGLGKITAEGVFGLQRGFKKAGVQTIIMSLWKVSDKATQIMMTEFYKEYFKTGDKRKAFLTAQQNLKNYSEERVEREEIPDSVETFDSVEQRFKKAYKEKIVRDYLYKNPYFWAAFILLD